MKEIKIVYYSGTNGTKLAAETFESKLLEKSYNVELERIFHDNVYSNKPYDFFILLFPLHAANAPKPVYEYIKSLPKGKNIKVAIVSVSAGGEVTFNKAGRLSSINLLEKQGYEVVYENSIIMPNNFYTATPEPLAKTLIGILPKKIDLIIDDLINNKTRRVKPPIIDKCISKVCEVEKYGVKIWGKTIRANETCNGCRLCEKVCSCGNISMKDNKPVFDSKCTLCTACLYSCPNKALLPGVFKGVMIKEGYNVHKIKKDNEEITKEEVLNLTEDKGWSGLRSYILDLL